VGENGGEGAKEERGERSTRKRQEEMKTRCFPLMVGVHHATWHGSYFYAIVSIIIIINHHLFWLWNYIMSLFPSSLSSIIICSGCGITSCLGTQPQPQPQPVPQH
jgi:hypothetical protein